MTQRGASPPNWAEILRNVIDLEAQRGFNNSSVVGGMDRFLERWRNEMAARIPAGSESSLLVPKSYAELSLDQRKQWAELWLGLIGNGEPVASAEADFPESPSSDGPTAPDSGPSPEASLSLPAGPAASKESDITRARPAFRLPRPGRALTFP